MSNSQGKAQEAADGAAEAQDLQRAPDNRSIVAAREAGRNRTAVLAGFVAGGGIGAAAGLPLRAVGIGPRTPALKGRRMRKSKLNAQLAPAMMSLAATNQQLLGLVGSRRNIMWRVVPLGIAAAGFRYMTAEPDERQAMVEQAQALAAQGQAMLESSGVLEKVFK
ncbi:MAG: hypothetical protein ACR2LK_12620 [Solirubrobacteraceae bacterium]